MCMFSGEVQSVSQTNIFARLDGKNHQYLVYDMTFGTDTDVAMILPLPVCSHAEDAVQFLSLEGYEHFFEDMESGFPRPRGLATALGADNLRGSVLEVHDVGAYEASFVPMLRDFGRLDSRFTLPRQVWDRLPQYADYGFAVFKLRGTAQETDRTSGPPWLQREIPPVEYAPPAKAHPMAFRFPTRAADRLFFPTVHVHDGEVHDEEEFDHSLFFQGEDFGQSRLGRRGPDASLGPAHRFLNVPITMGIVEGDARCFRYRVRGTMPNQDLWVR